MVVGIFLIAVIVIGLSIGALVYWIVKMVEVAQLPEAQFRAAGTEKVTWVLVVALGQIIGALIWQFAKRREVLESSGRLPAPAPGWYPDAVTGGMRWWDGNGWTGHRYAPPPQ